MWVLFPLLPLIPNWDLNSGPILWATPLASPFFCHECFRDRVLQTICLGLFWTLILLISAFWVARITGVSHQALAFGVLFYFLNSTRVLCYPPQSFCVCVSVSEWNFNSRVSVWKKALCYLSHTYSPILVIFWVGSCTFSQGEPGTAVPPTFAIHRSVSRFFGTASDVTYLSCTWEFSYRQCPLPF
jgi:hypothetical protein